jgi:cyanophycin synthetase
MAAAMPDASSVRSLRFHIGASAGLAERTARVRIAYGTNRRAPDAAGLRARIARLRPGDPLFGAQAADWPGCFLIDTDRGAGTGRWIAALTVGIQQWARDPVLRARVLAEDERGCTLALPWARERVCRTALDFALRMLALWLDTRTEAPAAPDEEAALAAELEAWLGRVQPGGLAPSTLRFALAALRRGLPVETNGQVIRIGWGARAQRMDSSFTDGTGTIASMLARDKLRTHTLLAENLLPVTPARAAPTWALALKAAREFGWPVVVKPGNLDQGAGVVTGLRDDAALRQAWDAATRLSPGKVLVERHVAGADHRLLVIGGRFVVATRRMPGSVTGNGRQRISELMAAANADPRRGSDKRGLLIRLRLDDEALACLRAQGLDADSIPEESRRVQLRTTANISTGGTAEDVTAQVHPDNRRLAERAARLVGLDIAGVDFLCEDISRSWQEAGGAICEVNAQPGFRVHWLGDPARDLNGEVIDWLFRERSARIPTAAISGTNGKSTVARMLHHVWMHAGKTAGVCTTNGVWIGHDRVSAENLSGYPGGRLLLNDPAVEVAVIEMPRKGLLRFGHPCDRYEVAALLNVRDDHIGVDGIDSLEEMARLKAQVLLRAEKAVVVNADDALCLRMAERAGDTPRILVSRTGETGMVPAHLASGGRAVLAHSGADGTWMVFAEGATRLRLMPLADIPATLGGLLAANEVNALFAAALAWAQGLRAEDIRGALSTFANSADQNPGRYNFIEGYPFRVLLDYAHNPDGIAELCSVVSSLPVTGSRRLLSLKLGNRHRAHLDACAPLLARHFESFTLGCDAPFVRECADYSGEDPEAMMLACFVQALQAAGVEAGRIVTERDKSAALRQTLASAAPGDLLVLLAEPWLALPILEASRPAAPQRS